MKLAHFLLLCWCWHQACVASLAAGPGGSLASPPKPNIVFILVDDLGWADLACYGADLHATPNIDRLAAGSVRFTDAYAAAPVCSPTRASVLTGKWPARLHMTIWYEAALRPPENRRFIPPKTVANLPHTEVTIAEVLQAAGYLTAHVGKWHLGDAAHYPETQGFDVNLGGTFWGAPSTFFHPYRGRWSSTDEVRYVPHLEWGEPGEYLTDRLTDEALTIIERAGRRPFFLYLAYHTVHTPIEAKAEMVDHYTRKLSAGQHHQNPTYAAMVHSLDENVGRLLAKLEQRGIAERTIVVLTSDNGGYVNDYRGRKVTDNFPLRSGKGSLYEGGVRVPLMVRCPGTTPASGICREPVVSTDFYPTLIEMTGSHGELNRGAEVDGVSLVPVLRDPNARLDRQNICFHYPHYYPTTTPVSAIRSDRWKLLEYLEDGRVELYDLQNDLGEQNNLAGALPQKARQLRETLADWRRDVGAQMPTPNPKFNPTAP